MNKINPWIEYLDLQPHPEGGFYREVYRSPIETDFLMPGLETRAVRSLATCIYYLIQSGAFSSFHRLRSDEIWIHLNGAPLRIHILNPQGHYEHHIIHGSPRGDSSPFITIPAGCWFAAEPEEKEDTLTACFVTPGFDFADFEIAERSMLSDKYPSHRELIARLTAGVNH